jgi:hypothetical protein
MTDRNDPRSTDRDPRAEDLRATTDAIQEDLKELLAIESRKNALAAADPRVDELSDAAVTVADRIARKTRAERELSDEIG